jgi:outer membrane lipoprotein-sorting protein
MTLPFVRVVTLALTLAASAVAQAAELPIIAKARAYLGSEEAIAAVKTIHYVGTLVTTDPADATKQTRAAIEIILQKPYRQRVTITSDKTIETTALDGYDGWTRITAATDPSKWQQTLLDANGIKRLRANTWENLGYFRGLEFDGGKVEDQGRTTVEGVVCEKVAFIHGTNIIFYRFFDVATGRVVYSETESGGTIREEGNITVDGLRFPKTIVTVSKNQAGKAQTVTITFDKITLNETFPPNFFAVPSLANF